MDKLRLIFTKTDRARFISHLDLLRCMQRAIKRAKLPILYTEGFNPRPYIMFPLPLSLGLSSCCEIIDFALIESMDFNEVKEKLNNVLPDGIKILKVENQDKKHTEIAFAQYDVKIKCDLALSEVKNRFDKFLSMENIFIEKMSKKKIFTTIDIKSDISVLNSEFTNDGLLIILKLPAGTQTNINHNVVFEAFQKNANIKIEDISIERTKILCANGEVFS